MESCARRTWREERSSKRNIRFCEGSDGLAIGTRVRTNEMRRTLCIFAATGLITAVVCALSWATPHAPQAADASAGPTFYRDVLPILQAHCQECHRDGGIAPMAFGTYDQTRIFAGAIRTATANKSMPPWFADAAVGKFSNDPSLSAK